MDKEEAKRTGEMHLKLEASGVFLVHLNVVDNQSVKQTVERYGEISVLVNNADVIFWKKLREQEYGEIEDKTRTNLEGRTKVIKECLPYVKDTIVNIASRAGLGML